jgi:outer membrane receptor protein involved in Fe transport
VSVGYQVRKPNDDLRNTSYQSWTSSAAVSYAFNKKAALSGQVGKDFSNTALDTTLDSLTAGLELQYAHNAKLTLSANVGYGQNDFLGPGGLIFGTNIGREDTSFDWGARIGYTFSQHLSLYLAYSYTQNWSNSIAGDYERSSWSAGASSRW